VPAVKGFSPTKGWAGVSVVVKGAGFTGATAVRFNTTTAASFTVNSDSKITAVVAAGTTSGPIVVDTPGGALASTSAFAIVPAPSPSVKSFSPSTGSAGALVKISGKHFTAATAVSFLDSPAESFTAVSDKRIIAVVAPGTLTGKIRVTTAGGTAASP
jgi:IPT/TIG domain-containing protein